MFWRQWPTFWWLCDKSGSRSWILRNANIACVVRSLQRDMDIRASWIYTAYINGRTDIMLKIRKSLYKKKFFWNIKHKQGVKYLIKKESIAYELALLTIYLPQDGTLCEHLFRTQWWLLYRYKNDTIMFKVFINISYEWLS